MNKILEVFDPALCCSSGVCGPSPDEALMAFAGALEGLKGKGVEVKRYNLAQQPLSFANNSEVMKILKEESEEALPLIYWDGELLFRGSYPSQEELCEAVCVDGDCCSSKEDAAPMTFAKVEAPRPMSSSCCDPASGCC